MGRPIGPRKVHRYSVDSKLTAVKLSGMQGVQVQMVADALDIHPFRLSRWGKEPVTQAHERPRPKLPCTAT